jgi:hypothetical protein
MQDVRDVLREAYDAEKSKLDDLNRAYQDLSDTVSELNDALSELGQVGFGELDGNFGEVSLLPTFGTETGDIDKLVEDINKQLKDQLDDIKIGLDIDAKWTDGAKNILLFLMSPGIYVIKRVWEGVGGAVIRGIWDGMKEGWNDFWAWVTELPGAIVQWFKNVLGIQSPSTVMAEIGRNIIRGLLGGITELLTSLEKTVTEIPGKIVAALGTGVGAMYGIGVRLVGSEGLAGGISAAFSFILSWAGSIGSSIGGAIGRAATWLWNKGIELMGIAGGLFGGILEQWRYVASWFTGLGGFITGNVGDLSSIMLNIGKDIIRGFWDGLKYGWNLVAEWWNSIVGGKGFTVPSFIPERFGGGKSITVPNLPIIEGGTFHTGGIVPGPGEMRATLMAGEMVLTGSQQARLFAMATEGRTRGSTNANETRVFNFYGDLSFPNITSGDDAGRFVDNLELLA